MEHTTATIEKLIEKAEVYAKTTVELCTLNAICKVSTVFSKLAVKLVLFFIVVLFLLMANIGVAMLVGDYLGKSYYGFFVVAFFYCLAGLVIYIFRNQLIKNPISNFIISQSLSKN